MFACSITLEIENRAVTLKDVDNRDLWSVDIEPRPDARPKQMLFLTDRRKLKKAGTANRMLARERIVLRVGSANPHCPDGTRRSCRSQGF